jgi:hypothetical protein
MSSEQRLTSVRTMLENNMETYHSGLTNYSISGQNEESIRLLLKETYETWKKCLDPNNVIDNQQLEYWTLQVEPLIYVE